MRCRVYPENLMGYFDWSFHLDNGDYIKKVTGTFVFERNSALLPNLNIAKKKVDALASIGTLFFRLSGQESFECPGDIDRDMNVKFKWSSFKIHGLRNDYSVANGSKSGTVRDFM